MAGQTLKGAARIVAACVNSVAGLKAAWKHEEAFRQECLLLIFGTPMGAWLGQNGVERALLIGALFMVVIVELLNTAVEATVDRIGFERHELAARAKDIGSAAVLLSLLFAATVWLLILIR